MHDEGRDARPAHPLPLDTWYRHVNAGDVGVRYGETPYHPNRRRKGPRPHPARAVPGRPTLDDRPAGATNRSRFGHYGMDTVVSSANGTGGLLVLIDRKSRRYVIELMAHVTQDDVVSALRRMVRRGALGNVRSITTDNGCEFPGPDRIGAVVGCGIYYTRDYAPWEKGSVENCNRLVRRWYPKGTDFGRCTRTEMHRLEVVINSIPPQDVQRENRIRVRHRIQKGRMRAGRIGAPGRPRAFTGALRYQAGSMRNKGKGKGESEMRVFELLPRPLGSIFRKLTHLGCNSPKFVKSNEREKLKGQ